MTEFTIELSDGEQVEVGELRLEKVLRIMDALAALTRASETATKLIAEVGPVRKDAAGNDIERDWWDLATAALPYIWREAREELDKLLATAIAELDDMEAAEAQGVLDAYMQAMGRKVRYHGGVSVALLILKALVTRVRQEVESTGGLGEALGGFSGAMEALMSGVVGSTESEPTGSTASPPTTDGAAETSSSVFPSSSSPSS